MIPLADRPYTHARDRHGGVPQNERKLSSVPGTHCLRLFVFFTKNRRLHLRTFRFAIRIELNTRSFLDRNT